METLFGILQASMLQLLLSKSLFKKKQILQVDYTLYIVDDNIDLIKSLKAASTALFQWFDDNLLKSNPGK